MGLAKRNSASLWAVSPQGAVVPAVRSYSLRTPPNWERQAAADASLCAYQLHIVVSRPRILGIGRLGTFRFPAGHYLYTGSARRNLAARVRRHLSRDKKRRWHIDYLLTAHGVKVVDVRLSRDAECPLNQRASGDIIVPGFGASDCRAHCGSHLKYLGEDIVKKTRYTDIEPYVTRDGSVIRELMHPARHAALGSRRQSLAEARVAPGEATALHRHRQSEELYHIVAGRGLMQLGNERFEVAAGDTVCIPPGVAHCIDNTGDTELRLLCCCSPAYAHDDTELL